MALQGLQMAEAAAGDAEQVNTSWVPGVLPGVKVTCSPLELDFETLPKWQDVRHTVQRIEPDIAEGGYGTVYRAVQGSKVFALKSMMLANHEEEAIAATEIRLLRLLGNHDRVVQMEEAYYEPARRTETGTFTRIVLVLESCFSTLRELHISTGSLSHAWQVLIVRQILEGLQRLQLAYVIHRDLHASNILVSLCRNTPGQFQFKLADFGTAAQVQNTGKHPRHHLWLRAKRNYTSYCVAPPEVLEHYAYTFGADSWAVGVMALNLVQDHPWLQLPQQPENTDRPYELSVLRITKAALRALPQLLLGLQEDSGVVSPGISFAAIAELLLLDPLERPTAENALRLLAASPEGAKAPGLPVADARRRRVIGKTTNVDGRLPTPWVQQRLEHKTKGKDVSNAASSGTAAGPRRRQGGCQESAAPIKKQRGTGCPQVARAGRPQDIKTQWP